MFLRGQARAHPIHRSGSSATVGLWSARGEDQSAECREHDGRRDADSFHWQLVSDFVADEHSRDVRQHHPERRAENDRIELLEPRGQADCGYLRLVAYLGEKESDERRRKRFPIRAAVAESRWLPWLIARD